MTEDIKKKTREALLCVANYYASPVKAFAHLFVFDVIVVVGYAFMVIATDPTRMPIEPPEECVGLTSSACDEHTYWTRRTVQLSPIGFMLLEYDDALLERRFRRDRINEYKAFAEAEIAAKRPAIFDERLAAIKEAAIYACRIGKSSDVATPPLLAGFALGENLAVGTGSRRVECTEESIGKGIEPTGAAVERADLMGLIRWFHIRSGATEAFQVRPFADATYCAKAKLSDGSPTGDAIATLARSGCNEAEIVRGLQEELLLLEDSLSFSFLNSEGTNWIFHLLAWSWLGLFANSLAGLMKAVKDNTYNGLVFAFFYPKILLAPLIAIVVVALVVYGLFELQINLAHQPMFLVFSFLSGYASEKFNGILQDAAHGILSSQKFDINKLNSAMTAPRIPFRAPPPPTIIDSPTTLDEYQANAKAAARHAVGAVIADHSTKDATE